MFDMFLRDLLFVFPFQIPSRSISMYLAAYISLCTVQRAYSISPYLSYGLTKGAYFVDLIDVHRRICEKLCDSSSFQSDERRNWLDKEQQRLVNFS